MSSSFGHTFRITTWGESHGSGVGVVIDGCPAGLEVSPRLIQADLDRRRPGQGRLTSPRQEQDRVEILSGVFAGRTLGTPIQLAIRNRDARPGAYDTLRDLYRPSHADFTYDAKYGHRDWRGGGRASARETAARVAAGAVAKALLHHLHGCEILAWVDAIHTIRAHTIDLDDAAADTIADPVAAAAAAITPTAIEASPVRCPDPVASAQMIAAIDAAQTRGDSLGGIVRALVRNIPAGWGEPVFDKLDALLAHAMLSIPAAKGFDLGSGFAGTRATGINHNDLFYRREDRIATRSNRSGGVQGGISNGEVIHFRVAFKPTPTIRHPQQTVDRHGEPVTFAGKGRHDPCVLPRAVPIIEAMAALVLADCALRARSARVVPLLQGADSPPPRPANDQ
jgi:chorismate synthase